LYKHWKGTSGNLLNGYKKAKNRFAYAFAYAFGYAFFVWQKRKVQFGYAFGYAF